MLRVSDCGNYRIECVNKENFEGALKVIKEGFCKDEAVCIGSEVNLNEAAAEELLELCAHAALDGVSLVAVHIQSNEVVAAAFNKIQMPASDSTERQFFEIFADEICKEESAKSLIRFMANVDSRCNLFEQYNADCSLEIMFLATLREHRKHGLGTLLCDVSMEVGRKLKDGFTTKINPKDLGPKYSHIPQSADLKTYPKICQALFTSNISQIVGKKLGFTVDLTVPYTEFEFKGRTYASRIGPQAPDCVLVSKVLW